MRTALALVLIFALGFLAWTGEAHSQSRTVHQDWFDRAAAAFEEGRLEDAIEAYDWILDREPENHEILYQYALAQEQLGNRRLAVRSVRRALRHAPDNVDYMELRYRLGFVVMRPFKMARERQMAFDILAVDSLNALANARLGSEHAQIYLHHRGRITVRELDAILSTTTRNPVVDKNDLRRSAPLRKLPVLRNPFDLDQLRVNGYTIIDIDERAEKAYPLAVHHLSIALQTDPTFLSAYESLMAIFAASRNHEDMMQWAVRMHEENRDRHQTWMYLGYASYMRDEFDKAGQYFNRALELMPSDLNDAIHDLNRVMRVNRDTTGLNEHFWDSRDPRYLTVANERSLEHYARFVYASLLFSEPELEMEGYDSDRGRVYIRYGTPTNEFYMTNVVSNCGERFTEFNMNAISNFNVFNYGDFQFVFGNEGNSGTGQDASNASLPALNEFRTFKPCADVMANLDALTQDVDYVTITKNNIEANPEQFDFSPAGATIRFPHLTSRFRGDDGKTDLYIAYGIPVTSGVQYETLELGLQAGAFVISPNSGKLAESRYAMGTVSIGEVAHFEGADIWLGTHYINSPTGPNTLSVEFDAYGGRAFGFQREELETLAQTPGQLTLSDLLLAYQIEETGEAASSVPDPGYVNRKGYFMRPAPWGVYHRSQPLYLYFEVYELGLNAQGRSEYQVEAALLDQRDEKGLERLFKRAFNRRNLDRGVSVRFTNTGSDSTEGQYLIMDAESEAPGDYVLIVRITDQVSKQTVETHRIIRLE